MLNAPTATLAIEALNAALEMLKGVELTTADAAKLVPLAHIIRDVNAYTAAVDAEIRRRVLVDGQMLPGCTTKPEVKHRVWNDAEAAAMLAREQFGDAAFDVKLKSPAGIEKLGDVGKVFVAMGSEKPAAGLKVVY